MLLDEQKPRSQSVSQNAKPGDVIVDKLTATWSLVSCMKAQYCDNTSEVKHIYCTLPLCNFTSLLMSPDKVAVSLFMTMYASTYSLRYYNTYRDLVILYWMQMCCTASLSVMHYLIFIYLFGVLRRFQHCTGHITTGSCKGRGNQYIQFARVVYCKLPTNGKQLPALPLKAVTGMEPRPQRWEARVLPLCHRGPLDYLIVLYVKLLCYSLSYSAVQYLVGEAWQCNSNTLASYLRLDFESHPDLKWEC